MEPLESWVGPLESWVGLLESLEPASGSWEPLGSWESLAAPLAAPLARQW